MSYFLASTPLNVQMHNAAASGDIARSLELIYDGASVNAQNWPYASPLHVASKNGQLAMVRLLLENGAFVNSRDWWSDTTALHVASEEGHLAVVRLLLEKGADVNARNWLFKRTPLHNALDHGHMGIVDLLLENGANVNDQDYCNRSALYIACEKGQTAIVELLLEKDADINATIRAASANGNAGLAERLTRSVLEKQIGIAALQDKWKLVRRLVTKGCDPNYGKFFLQRPLAVAVMHGKLDEAEFLLHNYAIRDLGDQFYPLRDAILRRDVQEAQAVLSRPRSLKPPKVETKRQCLQRHFHELHKIFLIGSQVSSVEQGYKKIAREMETHQLLWKTGMSGVRRLLKNRSPQNVQQVLGILCVASAMRKSIQSEDTFGDHDLFLEDLDRWRELAIEPQQQTLFDEIVFVIWGKRQNSTGAPDTFKGQEDGRNSLFEAIQNLVRRFATESSLPLAQLEHENFWEYYEPSRETSVSLYKSKASNKDMVEGRDDLQMDSVPDLRAFGNVHPPGNDSAERLDLDPDPGIKGLVPAMLMMGAIFACIIHFLFALHSGKVFLASSRAFFTQLSNSYQEFFFTIVKSWPAVEIEDDLKSATTANIIALEGWALQDRYELINSFLACTDAWLPDNPTSFAIGGITPTSSTASSFDQLLSDSEATSLSASTPASTTLSGSSPATISRHRCSICSRGFANMGNLNRHMRRHGNSSKHACQNAQYGCYYSDIRRDNVKKHEIKHCEWRSVVGQTHHR